MKTVTLTEKIKEFETAIQKAEKEFDYSEVYNLRGAESDEKNLKECKRILQKLNKELKHLERVSKIRTCKDLGLEE